MQCLFKIVGKYFILINKVVHTRVLPRLNPLSVTGVFTLGPTDACLVATADEGYGESFVVSLRIRRSLAHEWYRGHQHGPSTEQGSPLLV